MASDVGFDLGGLEKHAAPDSNRSQPLGVNLAADRAEGDAEAQRDVGVGEEGVDELGWEGETGHLSFMAMFSGVKLATNDG